MLNEQPPELVRNDLSGLKSFRTKISQFSQSPKPSERCSSNFSKIGASLISPKDSPQINKLYEKIRNFDSPIAPVHKSRISSQQVNEIRIRSPFKTPSPKSSHAPEKFLSEWDIKQALQLPKSKEINKKRVLLLNSLKSI